MQNYFGYFGHAWLCTPKLIVSTCRKLLMFICMPKINFIIHFFLEIIHFKESCNLIGQQHFGPYLENQKFARYGICGEISITILVFISDYFQEKLTSKFFEKLKKHYFGSIMGHFFLDLGKNEFSWKKVCQFLNVPIICHHAKNQKNLLSHS